MDKLPDTIQFDFFSSFGNWLVYLKKIINNKVNKLTLRKYNDFIIK